MARSSCKASLLDARAWTSAARAASGRWSKAATATPVCTFTAAMVCATTSWNSRAIRNRSCCTRRCASRSRSAAARASRAAYSASSSRRPRTTSPSSNAAAGHSISETGALDRSPVTHPSPADHTTATRPMSTVRRRAPCTATVYSATIDGRFSSSPRWPNRYQAVKAATQIAATTTGQRRRTTTAATDTTTSR